MDNVTLNLRDLSVLLSEEFDISVTIVQLIAGMANIQSMPANNIEIEEEDLSFIFSDEYIVEDEDHIGG